MQFPVAMNLYIISLTGPQLLTCLLFNVPYFEKNYIKTPPILSQLEEKQALKADETKSQVDAKATQMRINEAIIEKEAY